MSVAALETYLGPLKELLDRDGVAEVSINRPGEVWMEVKGEMHYEALQCSSEREEAGLQSQHDSFYYYYY